ncbi:uncharacterized protein LOC131930234 isoform X2 [Physella acuta]|uniref:uncharacterized protein LOC131930234 isoform X2 n=1 Tax=Physella acuta TaxID=109671 RepID=UPI0027DDFBAE|nr:uncharacterized protein LOC131930234 isoform X2 [Physella acuta]
MASSTPLVLVTGATGYVASHVVQQLLQQGHRVRATVRSLKDHVKVKHLHELCPSAEHKLELVEADLLDADSWTPAVQGCTYVQHVASPFPSAPPKRDDDLIRPAVDGTLNVLRAALASGTVQRVVLTSSVVAVASAGGNVTPYTESDWADEKSPHTGAYNKSKILAERAAWDFVKTVPERKFELAVVNPVLVVGPALHGNPGTSIEIIKRLMEHKIPRCPKFTFAVVDVRDVAKAHVVCMTSQEAAGKRHILSTANLWLSDIAKILDSEFCQHGYNIPTGELPNFVTNLASFFDKGLHSAKVFASKVILLDNSRMTKVLNISPRDVRTTFIDMGNSMIDHGLVKRSDKYKGRPSAGQQQASE